MSKLEEQITVSMSQKIHRQQLMEARHDGAKLGAIQLIATLHGYCEGDLPIEAVIPPGLPADSSQQLERLLDRLNSTLGKLVEDDVDEVPRTFDPESEYAGS